MPRMVVIGWDCVPPKLAFERYLRHMPNLARLMARGSHGPLRSTFPPITLPAWASMVSGSDPGELGMYGFRERVPGSYELRLSDATAVRAPRVWDLLAEQGLSASALFVPPSFPPRSGRVETVGCFLTPSADVEFCHPPHLKGELTARFGAFVPDVAHVGARPDAALLTELEAMTRQHADMARYVWERSEPDFMMFVLIGPDRFHHAFYRQLDETHPEYAPDPALGDVGARYYALLDRELGRLLEVLDDDTVVMVVSDHGARPLEGAFRINAWLAQQGYLAFREPPKDDAPIAPYIDWSRTRAWAEGGYYARVFFNVAGREPQGQLDPAQLGEARSELQRRLAAVCGPRGERWQNRIETPESLYGSVNGHAPDLLAVFDDLRIRPVASLRGEALYATGDDRGNDACNHDWDGIFVIAGPEVQAAGRVEGAQIYDVGASVLHTFGVEPPPGFRGRDLRGTA